MGMLQGVGNRNICISFWMKAPMTELLHAVLSGPTHSYKSFSGSRHEVVLKLPSSDNIEVLRLRE